CGGKPWFEGKGHVQIGQGFWKPAEFGIGHTTAVVVIWVRRIPLYGFRELNQCIHQLVVFGESPSLLRILLGRFGWCRRGPCLRHWVVDGSGRFLFDFFLELMGGSQLGINFYRLINVGESHLVVAKLIISTCPIGIS